MTVPVQSDSAVRPFGGNRLPDCDTQEGISQQAVVWSGGLLDGR